MRKLKIRNFGPVIAGLEENDGFIDIARVTVFIGSQGAGKSTITKLVSTLSWMEKSLVRGDLKAGEIIRYNWFVNKFCAYQGIKNYFTDKTEIVYRGRAYSFHYREKRLEIQPNPADGYWMPKIMYVPAERNFLSVVDKPQQLKNLPQSLYTFLDEFENAKQELGRTIELPVGNALFEYQKNNKISSLVGPGYKIRLAEASSGYQSLIPLYLVTRYLAESIGRKSDASTQVLSIEEEKRIKREIERILSDDTLSEEVKNASLKVLSARFSSSCFINIVEEPEQNLYPVSQKQILYKLLEYVNRNDNNQLLITTHSPYIVSYLTLAIKARMLWQLDSIRNERERSEKLSEIVPFAASVDGRETMIYEVADDGTVRRLETFEGMPSDNNFLNNLLQDMNTMFDNLLEIEEACR